MHPLHPLVQICLDFIKVLLFAIHTPTFVQKPSLGARDLNIRCPLMPDILVDLQSSFDLLRRGIAIDVFVPEQTSQEQGIFRSLSSAGALMGRSTMRCISCDNDTIANGNRQRR